MDRVRFDFVLPRGVNGLIELLQSVSDYFSSLVVIIN